MEKVREFVGSDNWWIENNRAWFVEVNSNILFGIDLYSGECDFMVSIPDDNSYTFRLTPYCIKGNNSIFCLPGCGECIWVYDLETQQFSRINIDNPDKLQLDFDFWIYEGKIFAISGQLKKMVEINISQKKIDNYYMVFEESGYIKSVRIGNIIYSLQVNKIYQFDLTTKTIEKHALPNVEGKLYTICHDGEKFWMSGYSKEIYIWGKDSNKLEKINDFPSTFGVYNFETDSRPILDCTTGVYKLPAFVYTVAAGDYIWFIPGQTNKIIYINRVNYQLYTFEIEEEEETRESLRLGLRSISTKYLLEYVKEGRYIGLFSLKHNRILEIDTKKFIYYWKNYYLSDKCLLNYAEINKNIFFEGNLLSRMAYSVKVQSAWDEDHNLDKNSVGTHIYKSILS